MLERYILIDKQPVYEPDIVKWARWMYNNHNKRVCLDNFDGIIVSTVFLGLDHGYSEAEKPVLFETMVFYAETGYEDQYMERCSTWDEAVEQHNRVVELFKKYGRDFGYGCN